MKTRTDYNLRTREIEPAARNPRKNFVIGLIALLLATLSVPSLASGARQRYVLDFDDTFIRSYQRDPATILLKKTLRVQYPEADIKGMKLRKVILVAKTKMGRGGAKLRVGHHRTENYQVHGNPWEFNDHYRYTFDRVRFRNPAHDSRGPWQVDLWGNFIVRKIVLVVDEPTGHGRHRNHHRERGWRY